MHWESTARLLDKGGWLKSHFAHFASALLCAVGAILDDTDAHGESRVLERLNCVHPAWHDLVAIADDAMMRERYMRGIQDILEQDIMAIWHFSHEPAKHAKPVNTSAGVQLRRPA